MLNILKRSNDQKEVVSNQSTNSTTDELILSIKDRINKKEITKYDIECLLGIYLSITDKLPISTFVVSGDRNNKDIIELSKVFLHYPKEEIKNLIEEILLSSPVGKWLMSIKGMQPTLAAELIVRLNVDGKECATQFLNYCGINNNTNYNQQLKAVVDRLGFIFAEYNANDSLYHDLYKTRLDYEFTYNSDNVESLEHIYSKTRRWVEKIFICHLFTEMYYAEYGTIPERRGNRTELDIPEVDYIK